MFNQLDGKSLPLSDAIPQANAGAGASGTANDIARSDHTHPLQVTTTTAEALGTTGADVTVGTAAPPTTGQILTATSATTATWQTFSGPTILSGGTKIQSGYFGGGGEIVTFSVAFTGAPIVVATHKFPNSTTAQPILVHTISTTGFKYTSPIGFPEINWIAIGT